MEVCHFLALEAFQSRQSPEFPFSCALLSVDCCSQVPCLGLTLLSELMRTVQLLEKALDKSSLANSLPSLHPHDDFCYRNGSFCLHGSPSAIARSHCDGRAPHLSKSVTALGPSPYVPHVADPDPTSSELGQEAADEGNCFGAFMLGQNIPPHS